MHPRRPAGTAGTCEAGRHRDSRSHGIQRCRPWSCAAAMGHRRDRPAGYQRLALPAGINSCAMDATPAALEWRVEETCLSAWPALQEVLFDGWLLRFSEGLTRRANSANPLRPLPHADLPACELLYRRQKLPTIFRVLSLIAPSVDEQLASAGYTDEGDSCVLYGGIDEIEMGPDPDVCLLSKPNPEWFRVMAALQNHTIEQASIYQRIVGQIAIPASFVALFANGEVVALAYERL